VHADAVQEVDPLEQIGEAVRLEDHRHQVRTPLFIARDQVGRERPGRALQAVLEIHEMVARPDKRMLGASKLLLTLAQRALHCGQAPVRVRQSVRGDVDPRGLVGDL
jgi:hypothetical protein